MQSEEERKQKREEQANAREENQSGRQGLVILNTGKGKGKSTAAYGLMMRAWGRDFRVVVHQFIKHSSGNWGEVRAANEMNIEWNATGKGFTWESENIEEDKALAEEAWASAEEHLKAPEEQYDIVILDELTYLLHYDWLPLDTVIETLDQRPDSRHVVITGRYAPEKLIEYADLITEMKQVKHPYHDQGINAQAGIEF